MAYQQTLTGAQQAHPPTIRTIGMADLKDALRKVSTISKRCRATPSF